MPLNLSEFKKTPTKPLDISSFKATEKPEKKSLLKKYQEGTQDVAKNTAAYGFEGISRAAGALTDLSGRAVGAAAKGSGVIGSGIYRGLGNVVGLFSDKGEAALDQVADNFKRNQYQFAEMFKEEGQKLNRFMTGAGEDAREDILKTDKEAYDELQESRQQRAKDVADGKSDFKWGDLTEADFWVHDFYGGLLQNAPTMALSLYAGGGAGASNTVLSYLAKAGTATAFSTGMNAAIEADSAYQSALDEGKDNETALIEADRVFYRNASANGGTEAAQMLLLFAPQLKFTSPWLKAAIGSGKLGLAGAFEAGQERAEDAIQEQADLETFDWDKFTESVSRKGLSRTDVISFLMGMAFQGGGNIFVNNEDVKKAATEKVKQVAENLPDDGQGGTAEERVERAIENNPTAVEEAVAEVDTQIGQVTEQGREEAKVARLSNLAQEAIDSGRSPSEVVVALSGQIPATRAREIVDAIEPRKTDKVEIPTAKELIDQSPSELQRSISKLDDDFKTKSSELQQSIETLQKEVKEAPKNSKVKLEKKQELERSRNELRTLDKRFRKDIAEGGAETRRQVERYIIDNTDFTRAEQRVLADRVIDKVFSTGVNVPISTVIRNEVNKFNPASSATETEIEAAAAKITNDKKRQAKLVDQALEVLQSDEFAPVVADMTLDQVMTELMNKDGQFQVKNVSRKPTGKAKFKNIHNDDLRIIGDYIDAVRSDKDVSAALNKEFLRLAERYGIKTDQSEKQIVLAFERLIDRYNMDDRLDALMQDEKSKKESKKKEETKQKKSKQIKKKEEERILAEGDELPPEIQKQLAGLPFMKGIPVRMVKRITTPEGYEAFGRFYRGIVEFVENPDITTVPHESFHTASQMALTTEERQAMYKLAQEAYADPELTTDFATEERLAQDFAEWYVTEQNPANLSDRIIGYFRKIKDFILDMVTKKNRAALKEIFEGMMSEEIVKRVQENKQSSNRRFFQTADKNEQHEPELFAEARKYKSAEEFVKAQKPLYHGTNAQFDRFDPEQVGSNTGEPNTIGTFFSESTDEVASFRKSLQQGFGSRAETRDVTNWRVIERYLPPDAKVFDLNLSGHGVSIKQAELLAKIVGNESGETLTGMRAKAYIDELIDESIPSEGIREVIFENADEFRRILNEEGYIGYTDNMGGGKKEFVVFDPEKDLVTKSQLEDIWNQAHQNRFDPTVLYQLRDEDQRENSLYLELSAELERIMFEVETMFELSEAGYRLVNDDGSVRAVESTFPKWIPERLRSKQLMDTVLQQYLNNEPPKGAKQAELHQVIEDYVLNELPAQLADEKVLNDYFAEQYKVADELRRDTLDLMKRMALKIAERQATMKKGDVKKTIRTNTNQIKTDTREFSKKLKERARFFNRGYKKGYRQGASDKFREILMKRKAKRERSERIDKVKSIYRRVRQATRTGAYLPIEYQERLSDLFEDFDMTKMTASTQKKLSNMALYWASQEGEVPKDVAKKLERISKFAIGEMTDEQLEEFVTEVTRIFEQGVKKKELLDARDEKLFKGLVERVNTGLKKDRSEKSGFNLATFDPSRVADMLDGTHGRYDGAFFKEVIEPIRIKGDEADLESNALLADTFEQISAYGNSFTEEQMARIAVEVYRRQEGLEEAVARTVAEMEKRGHDMDSPITETEAAIADILSETFKEIRGEVAATYEAINNRAFPDLKNYFPVKYDKDIEKFDINDANEMWDFTVTKTSSGFTVARKDNVQRVLDTNIFHTLVTEVNKQTFYAKMQPALDKAVNVVNAEPVKANLTPNEQRYFATFIKDVATQGRRHSDNAVIEEARKVSSKIRTNINQAILFYKMSTILIQPTAVFDGAANINKRFGTVAAWKVVPNLLRMAIRPSLVKQAQAQSLALANRAGGQIELKEMRDAQQGTFSPSPWRKAYSIYQKYGAAGIKKFDLVTAAAVWDRAYQEFKKDGLSEEQATLAADQLTSLSQSSANITNRPQFLNSEAIKFAMPFQTFLTNAANNVRYDLVETEIKSGGYVTGTIRSLNNLQFILYAVSMEAVLRDMYSKLWGYEDDDDDTWYKKLWASTVGRVPLSNWFLDFDGNLKDKIALDHPAAKSANDVFNVISDFANSDDITNKEIYNAVKGLMVLFGVAGTQQIHQLVTAPDIAGLGSIGEDLGLTYDQRTLQEKQSEKLQEVMGKGDVKEADIESIAADIYGKNYDEKGVEYRTGKNMEVMQEVAFRQKWGFEDEFLNINLNKKSNNDVKAYYATHDVNLKDYSRPVEAFGTRYELLSDQLTKELMYIDRASEKDKKRIAALAVAENDEEKKAAIGGDKDFAKRATFNYKLISKELYETIK